MYARLVVTALALGIMGGAPALSATVPETLRGYLSAQRPHGLPLYVIIASRLCPADAVGAYQLNGWLLVVTRHDDGLTGNWYSRGLIAYQSTFERSGPFTWDDSWECLTDNCRGTGTLILTPPNMPARYTVQLRNEVFR